MNKSIEVLLVDEGNTQIKSAEVVQGEFINRHSWNSYQDLLSKYPETPKMVSNLASNSSIEGSNLTTILSYKTKIPVKLKYDTPETLGPDRIALAVGTNVLFPNENNLVIDLGTCATMDVIDRDANFHGGIIAPGLSMRMKAMSKWANLPDISNEWNDIHVGQLGKSTKECLVIGSFVGLLREIQAFIAQTESDFTSLNIILTGGDALFFESKIKAHIFAGSKIVEAGLYRIWKYQ